MTSFEALTPQEEPKYFSFSFNFCDCDDEKNLQILYTSLTACAEFIGAELSIVDYVSKKCRSLDDTCALIYGKRKTIGSWGRLLETYRDNATGAVLTAALQFENDDGCFELVKFSVVIPAPYCGEEYRNRLIVTVYVSDYEDASDAADIVIDELHTALLCTEYDFCSWDDKPVPDKSNSLSVTDDSGFNLFDNLPY